MSESEPKQVTFKVRPVTLKVFQLIKDITGETMASIAFRLAVAELEKIKENKDGIYDE